MYCKICGRDGINLERHHLYPGMKKKETIEVCVHCGDQIHKLFTNKKLRDEYNTLKALLKNEKIKKLI